MAGAPLLYSGNVILESVEVSRNPVLSDFAFSYFIMYKLNVYYLFYSSVFVNIQFNYSKLPYRENCPAKIQLF